MNGQSKTSSLVESLANIVVGMGISFVLTEVLLHAPLAMNAWLTALLTVVSIVRQFVLRRLFNWRTTRREARELGLHYMEVLYHEAAEAHKMREPKKYYRKDLGL